MCADSQSGQVAPQPQSMFHSGGLAPTPPNLPPGHSSPQVSYTLQGYSLPTHQPLPHGFPSISQLTQVSNNLLVRVKRGSPTEMSHFPFVLFRLTSKQVCQDITTLPATARRPSCCTTLPLSRAAAPPPSRGRLSTSTSDPPKVNTGKHWTLDESRPQQFF